MIRSFCFDSQQLCCMKMKLHIFLSTRLNKITRKKKYHSTTEKMLEKTRILWKNLDPPNVEDEYHKKIYVLCQTLHGQN